MMIVEISSHQLWVEKRRLNALKQGRHSAGFKKYFIAPKPLPAMHRNWSPPNMAKINWYKFQYNIILVNIKSLNNKIYIEIIEHKIRKIDVFTEVLEYKYDNIL
jgi:hypothetical protein